MTDDEKLAQLDVTENDGWVLMEQAKTLDESIDTLNLIERCQRIRTNLSGVQDIIHDVEWLEATHSALRAEMNAKFEAYTHLRETNQVGSTQPIFTFSDDRERRYDPKIFASTPSDNLKEFKDGEWIDYHDSFNIVP